MSQLHEVLWFNVCTFLRVRILSVLKVLEEFFKWTVDVKLKNLNNLWTFNWPNLMKTWEMNDTKRLDKTATAFETVKVNDPFASLSFLRHPSPASVSFYLFFCIMHAAIKLILHPFILSLFYSLLFQVDCR